MNTAWLGLLLPEPIVGIVPLVADVGDDSTSGALEALLAGPVRMIVQAVGLPLIDILPVDDASLVHQAWRDLHDYAAVMFVSANAVTGFFESKPLASQWALTHTTNTTPPRVWATGPGTVAVLQQSGVPLDGVDAPPPEAAQFDSEALWQQVNAQVRVGQRVLIVRGGDAQLTSTAQGVVGGLNVGQDLGAGRDWLAARLRAAGVMVDFVVPTGEDCRVGARRRCNGRGMRRATARSGCSAAARQWPICARWCPGRTGRSRALWPRMPVSPWRQERWVLVLYESHARCGRT